MGGFLALGDPGEDLVFVPVTPCRIIDTRVAGGAIAANSIRNFDVTAASSYATQGGEASDCGIGNAGAFAAAVINFTVVGPSAAGYLTAYPLNVPRPLAATVNYVAGEIRGNLSSVRLDQGPNAAEMSVYTFAQAHLVADVVGYFTNPSPPEMTCVETAQTETTVAARNPDAVLVDFNRGSALAPACAAGYFPTATHCEGSSFGLRLVTQRNGRCAALNEWTSPGQIRASQTCCRVVSP